MKRCFEAAPEAKEGFVLISGSSGYTLSLSSGKEDLALLVLGAAILVELARAPMPHKQGQDMPKNQKMFSLVLAAAFSKLPTLQQKGRTLVGGLKSPVIFLE